jgi:16S rRNA (uracil1498-N3)-methyltransferase
MQKGNKNFTTYFFSNNNSGEHIILENDEFIHCIKTLRNEIGNSIQVLDGLGHEYFCEIIDVAKSNCTLKIISTVRKEEKKNTLFLAVAPTKHSDRFEWLLEKCVELGVDKIQPILTEKTEKFRLNLERLNRISIAALKQSGNLYLPQIMEPIKYSQFIKKDFSSFSNKLIAHCQNSELKNLKTANLKGNTIFLIGPEGDFTLLEIELSKQNNFEEISLGTQRLRTETAAIFVCGAYHFSNM